jgi:ribosomal protein S18 acetylase RimI-like enzyme
MTDNYLNQSNDEIEYFKVKMFRPNMDSIPLYPLPPGYSFKLYNPNTNDDQKWAEIAAAAGEFRSIQQGHEFFVKTFLNDKDSHLLPERLYFLVNPEGRYIGTAMAWVDKLDEEEQGSLFWVSIIPEYQGKKLAKPLVSTVLHKISEFSDKCFLGSQTTSWKAINMYSDFGFKPYMKMENSEKSWKLLSDICKKNFLDNH